MDSIIRIILLVAVAAMAYVILTMVTTRDKLQRRQQDRDRVMSGGDAESRPRRQEAESQARPSASPSPSHEPAPAAQQPSQAAGPSPRQDSPASAETASSPEGGETMPEQRQEYDSDTAPVSGSEYTRAFWTKYQNLLSYPPNSKERIAVLDSLLRSNQITKKTYAELLYEPMSNMTEADGGAPAEQKPEQKAEQKPVQSPAPVQTEPSEPVAVTADDFDNDDFGMF